MTESILKLKIDSSEYNQKIKRAAESIQQYADECRKAGGTLEYLDDGVLEFVQAIGRMDTVATSSKQQLREMSNALTTLTDTYRNLTDEEKSTPFGRELAKGIEKITERAGALQDTIGDVQTSIKNAASDTRLFDQMAQGMSVATASIQGLTGAAKLFGIESKDNLEVIAKLQAAMAVTNSLTTIQNALQKESALMQGVMAVKAKAAAIAVELEGKATKGATVAQAAFNAVAKANPYVLLASAVAAVGVALVGFSKNAKEAESATKSETEAMKQAARMADIWKNTMGSTYSSLMTKYDELKRQWLSLKDEHSKIDWIKKNQTALHDLGGAVNDVKSAEDFFNNNTDAVVQSFVRRAQAAAYVAKLTELYRKQIELLDKKQQTQTAIQKDASKYGRSANAGDEITDATYRNSRYGSVNQRTGKWEFSEQGAKLYSGTDTSTASSVVKIDVELEVNQSEIDKVEKQIEGVYSDIIVPTSSNKNKDTKGESKPEQAAAKYEQAQNDYNQALAHAALDVKSGQADSVAAKKKELAAAENLWKAIGDAREIYDNDTLRTAQAAAEKKIIELGGALNSLIDEEKKTAEAAKELADTQKKISEAGAAMAIAEGSNDLGAFYKAREDYKSAGGTSSTMAVDFSFTEGNLSAFIKKLKDDISTADLGTDLYNNLTAQIADASALGNLLQLAIKNGIDVSQFNPQELWKKVFSENPGDYLSADELEAIRARIQEILGQPIKLNLDTGDVKNATKDLTKDAKQNQQAWSAAASAVSNLSGALQSLDDPSAKIAGIVGQAVANIALGFAQASASPATGAAGVFGWIAAATAGLATMVATITQIKSVTKGFAEGGIVPGNHYSGDLLSTADYGINSGELILNRAQQDSIASQLTDGNGGQGNTGTSLVSVDCENIRIVLKNGATRRGMSVSEYLQL